MAVTRSATKKTEARPAPYKSATTQSSQTRVTRSKASGSTSTKPQGSARAPQRAPRLTLRLPAREAPHAQTKDNKLNLARQQHLRVLHRDAPAFCALPRCKYYIGTTIDDVNGKVGRTRSHVKNHYAPRRNAQGKRDPKGKRDLTATFRCRWPGCRCKIMRNVTSLARHTEEAHLGWRYACPDTQYHAGKKRSPTFCRADPLTKHFKELAGTSHMSKPDMIAMLDKLVAAARANRVDQGNDEGDENYESDDEDEVLSEVEGEVEGADQDQGGDEHEVADKELEEDEFEDEDDDDDENEHAHEHEHEDEDEDEYAYKYAYEDDDDKENHDVFSVVPDFVRDLAPVPDWLGNFYDPEEISNFQLADWTHLDDLHSMEDVQDHATPDASLGDQLHYGANHGGSGVTGGSARRLIKQGK